jgi:hypothetical protein
VIGQDLDAGPDDEDHEQRVQEMLRVHPPRQPRMGAGGDEHPRVAVHEPLNRGYVPQALGYGNRGEQLHPADRQRPRQVEPLAAAYPHPRRYPSRGWQRPGPRLRIDDILASGQPLPVIIDRRRAGIDSGARSTVRSGKRL